MEVFSLTDVLGEVELGLVVLKLVLKDAAGREVFADEVLFTQSEEVPYGALQNLPASALSADWDGGELVVVNRGDAAAMFVNIISADRKRPVVVSDNARILMPGEALRTKVSAADGGEVPELIVRSLNAVEGRI